MRICVFCSANQQLDPDFFAMTEELGRWLATAGHTLVYGGVNSGLMECVARAVKQAGGRTVAIIPQIVEKGGRISDYVDVEVMCDNLSDRKQLMEGDTRGQTLCAQLSAEDYDGRQEVTRRGVIARVITSIVFSLEVISITPNRN